MAQKRKPAKSQRDVASLFRKLHGTIDAGVSELFFNPPFLVCGHQTHHPFEILKFPIQFSLNENQKKSFEAFCGYVSTDGWQYDGDRTDVHDIYSLCWAAFMRTAGIASSWLIDEDGFCGPHEMDARLMIFHPHSRPMVNSDAFEKARESLNAWSAFGYHLLDAVFEWEKPRELPINFVNIYDDEKTYVDWIAPVQNLLRKPRDYTIIKREDPNWEYFSVLQRGISIVRIPRIRMRALKFVLSTYRPLCCSGEHAYLIFANGIANGIPFNAIKKGLILLDKTGDDCVEPLIVPIESHCLLLGDDTLIAIRENCGREVYDAERSLFEKRRALENQVFFADSHIEWNNVTDPGQFEDMCVDLLICEPGVYRAKQVGNVNDRDGGRDILIDWAIPSEHTNQSNQKVNVKRFLAQVKTRGRTIGKNDVRDIRDTLERHNAHGFLLIAHPRISSALVDYLEDLRLRKKFKIDWWEKRDLETRLRRHPDIARRYPKLIKVITD